MLLARDRHIRWACRRGMLELDLLLAPFAEHHYSRLSEHDKVVFQRLLQCNDQELYFWLIGKEIPDDTELATLVKDICQYAITRALQN